LQLTTGKYPLNYNYYLQQHDSHDRKPVKEANETGVLKYVGVIIFIYLSPPVGIDNFTDT